MADSKGPEKGAKPTIALLRRCHSPNTAKEIYASKIQHHPLTLTPTKTAASILNSRAERRVKREEKRKRKKAIRPKPLSAKEKRALRVHEVASGGKEAWERYAGLRKLWMGYIRDVLGLTGSEGGKRAVGRDEAGAMLVGADFHGAVLTVVRCKCVERVGIEGTVVKDGMGIFTLVTRVNEVKKVPKEGTVFQLKIDVDDREADLEAEVKQLVFEIHGDGFRYRPADRAGKKFKQRSEMDL